MNYSELLQSTAVYIRSYLVETASPELTYHNLEHTEYVAAVADQLAKHYQLQEQAYFIVLTAAWFHDIGYVEDTAHPEEAGAKQAAAFLREKGADEKTIEAVSACILATAVSQPPASLPEQLIKDAVFFYLGTDSFKARNKLLRQEYEATHRLEISREAWRRKTIELLEKHQYYTDYCREKLGDKKQQHLRELMQKGAKQVEDPDLSMLNDYMTGEGEAQVKEIIKKAKSVRPDRGIETMFKITSNKSQRLSEQADTKAHILITVNSIIISVLLGTVVRQLDSSNYLTIPTMMLLMVSLITIVFSILATRPHIPKGTYTRQDFEENKVNLLFFGNFYRMPFEEYAQGMLKMMEDRNFLYAGLIRDVYSQGIVLGKKYRMLTLSYNVFMFGLIISVVAFFIASKYYAPS